MNIDYLQYQAYGEAQRVAEKMLNGLFTDVKTETQNNNLQALQEADSLINENNEEK